MGAPRAAIRRTIRGSLPIPVAAGPIGIRSVTVEGDPSTELEDRGEDVRARDVLLVRDVTFDRHHFVKPTASPVEEPGEYARAVESREAGQSIDRPVRPGRRSLVADQPVVMQRGPTDAGSERVARPGGSPRAGGVDLSDPFRKAHSSSLTCTGQRQKPASPFRKDRRGLLEAGRVLGRSRNYPGGARGPFR